jgi:hypothetical protein
VSAPRHRRRAWWPPAASSRDPPHTQRHPWRVHGVAGLRQFDLGADRVVGELCGDEANGPAASVHIGGLAVVGWGDVAHLACAVAARVRAGADPDHGPASARRRSAAHRSPDPWPRRPPIKRLAGVLARL